MTASGMMNLLRLDELKDTVGAGDTFMATMLVWLVQNGAIGQLAGLSLGDKLAMVRRAAQAAAINCSRRAVTRPLLMRCCLKKI